MTKSKGKQKFKYNVNHYDDGRYKARKNENRSKNPKNKRGNWSFSIWQQFVKRLKELHIKSEISQKGSFDPNKIDMLMDPNYISNIDKIKQKISEGKKLTKKEQTILEVDNNRIEKKKEADNKFLETEGLLCKVRTNHGMIKKLISCLKKAIYDEKYDLVYFIMLKFKQKRFKISNELLKEHKIVLDQATEIINTLDTIKLQFTKFFDEMPPLNQSGFVDLEPFQRLAIKAMREKRSFIIKAPTSSGKSIITSYLAALKYVKRILLIVPTSALAWHMSGLFSNIIGEDVPIITRRFKSEPGFNELIELIKSSRVIVGTPCEILNWLPIKDIWDVMKSELDYIILDEIHMMGESNEYMTSEMEILAKIFYKKNINFAALSATIGNVNDLHNWFTQISEPGKDIEVIECNERFFNLESFYYKPKEGFIKIHPLAPITIDEFRDRSILNKDLYPVPNDIWKLYEKLVEFKFDLGDLDAYKYFNKKQHIKLKESYLWFEKLINFMVDNSANESIECIINSYNIEDFDEYDPDLIELLYNIKNSKMTPAIIFSDTTETVLENARNVSRQIKNNESKNNKDLDKSRLRQLKINAKIEKKNDREKGARGTFKGHAFEKKELKNMINLNKKKTDTTEEYKVVSLREPLKEYIFSNDLKLTEGEIDNIADDLKEYGFKNGNNDLHYVIDLLWRSVGVYCTGMPEDYLRLVQMLATKKKVVIVFSDNELVYGVSMPWRTVVVLRDNNYPYEVSISKNNQRSGRCGRRGLDKRGLIVYVGQSSNEIKRLTTGSVANIGSVDTRIYSLEHAILLSEDEESWRNIITNNFNQNISDEESIYFYDNIKKNLYGNGEEAGAWHFAIETNEEGPKLLKKAEEVLNKARKLLSSLKIRKSKSKKFSKKNNQKLKEANKVVIEEYEKFTKVQKHCEFLKNKAMYFNHLMHKLRSASTDLDWVRVAYLLPYINRIFREINVREESNQILLCNFLLNYINTRESDNNQDLPKLKIDGLPINLINLQLSSLGVGVPEKIDGTLFFSIRENRLIDQLVDGVKSDKDTYKLRNKLLEFLELIIPIQNYYYLLDNEVNITRLFGKLLTRLKWIYVNSNPIMSNKTDSILELINVVDEEQYEELPSESNSYNNHELDIEI